MASDSTLGSSKLRSAGEFTSSRRSTSEGAGDVAASGALATIRSCCPLAALTFMRLILSIILRSARSGVVSLAQARLNTEASSSRGVREALGVTSTSTLPRSESPQV